MNGFSDRGLLSFVGYLVRELLVAASVIAAGATIAAFGARWWWPLELCTHFRPHYLVGLAIGTIICALTHRRAFAVFLGVAAVYNVGLIVPLYHAPPAHSITGRNVRLLLANVHVHNSNHRDLLNFIEQADPDIILTLEVNSDWMTALAELSSEYPQYLGRPRDDSFGIAIWSRLSTDELMLESIGKAEVPSVVAHFDDGDEGLFTLIGTHPLPPIGAEYAALRNDQLQAIGAFAARQSGPVVVAGDLNTTSWSPYFCDLLATSGLRDTRRGFGVQPSWPSRIVWIGIAIDHVLASPEIAVAHRAVGPAIGSDHRPVIIDVVVPDALNSEENAVIPTKR